MAELNSESSDGVSEVQASDIPSGKRRKPTRLEIGLGAAVVFLLIAVGVFALVPGDSSGTSKSMSADQAASDSTVVTTTSTSLTATTSTTQSSSTTTMNASRPQATVAPTPNFPVAPVAPTPTPMPTTPPVTMGNGAAPFAGFPKLVPVSTLDSRLAYTYRIGGKNPSTAVALAPGVYTVYNPNVPDLNGYFHGPVDGDCAMIRTYFPQSGGTCWENVA
jgi:hypothetical protein